MLTWILYSSVEKMRDVVSKAQASASSSNGNMAAPKRNEKGYSYVEEDEDDEDDEDETDNSAVEAKEKREEKKKWEAIKRAQIDRSSNHEGMYMYTHMYIQKL